MNRIMTMRVFSFLAFCSLFLVGCVTPVTTHEAIDIDITTTSVPVPPTPVPPTPNQGIPLWIVVDTSGTTYEVTNLQAKYRANGLWTGPNPETIEDTIFVVLHFTEEHITITENLEISLSSLQRLVFIDPSLNSYTNHLGYQGQFPVHIEMQDGTAIQLSDNLLIETDAQNIQTRVVNLDSYSFVSETERGVSVILRYFIGRAKTESGLEGEFHIPVDEVQSIELKEP